MRTAYVVSGDSEYVRLFGPAFVMTAVENAADVHLHMVDPDPHALMFRDRALRVLPSMTVTTSKLDRSLDIGDRRCEYAAARFHILPELFEQGIVDRAFIMDIDSLINRPFEWMPSDKPVGLYLRDPVAAGARTPDEVKGMRCIACCWVWKEQAVFAEHVSKYIRSHPRRWFIDQEALYETYLTLNPPVTNFGHTKIVDWEFHDESTIWTGKGSRKYSVEKYFNAQLAATRRFNEIAGA